LVIRALGLSERFNMFKQDARRRAYCAYFIRRALLPFTFIARLISPQSPSFTSRCRLWPFVNPPPHHFLLTYGAGSHLASFLLHCLLLSRLQCCEFSLALTAQGYLPSATTIYGTVRKLARKGNINFMCELRFLSEIEGPLTGL
jgi:hypothetical protein